MSSTAKLSQSALANVRLLVNEHMQDEGEVSACNGSRIGMYSAHSPDKTSDNEDSAAVFCFNQDAVLLCVADGMGGLPCGTAASKTVIDTLHSTAQKVTDTGNGLRENILDAMEAANRDVIGLGVGAGTTVAIAEICNHSLRSYHVGDSIVLVVGQRGKIKFQTIPHSPVGYAVEAGLIDEKEAIHHEQRHLISNILGDPEMRIDMGPIVPLAKYDTVLLASDGLYDNLHIEEIVEMIRKGPLPGVMRQLKDTCLQRMTTGKDNVPSKPDDLTFLLYRNF